MPCAQRGLMGCAQAWGVFLADALVRSYGGDVLVSAVDDFSHGEASGAHHVPFGMPGYFPAHAGKGTACCRGEIVNGQEGSDLLV